MSDFSFHHRDGSLTAGFRGGSLWIAVCADGREQRLPLPLSAARSLAEWVTKSSPEEATPYQILRAGAEALGALAGDKFVRKTSREFWDRGFDVNGDECEWCEGDDWFAIHDPNENEIEVYVMARDGDIGGAKVCVSTGKVVRL